MKRRSFFAASAVSPVAAVSKEPDRMFGYMDGPVTMVFNPALKWSEVSDECYPVTESIIERSLQKIRELKGG